MYDFTQITLVIGKRDDASGLIQMLKIGVKAYCSTKTFE